MIGLPVEAVLLGLLAAVALGWVYTTYMWRTTLLEMRRAQYWWEWWAERATEADLDISDDDITAAQVLAPGDGPPVADQMNTAGGEG